MFVLLPWPPSENRYRRYAGFMPILSRAGREYKKIVKTIFRTQGIPTISGPVSVRLVMAPPDNRKRDLDNTLKALFDAISDDVIKVKDKPDQIVYGIISDDSNIVRLEMNWSKKITGGQVLMEIIPCNEDRDDFCRLLDSIRENGYYIYNHDTQ